MDLFYRKILPNSILLETTLQKSDEFRNILFTNPIQILEAYTLNDLEIVLKEIETYLEKDLYLAGYLSYEAGYLFETSFKKLYNDKVFTFPLLWFGIYENPIIQKSPLIENNLHTTKAPFSIQNLSLDLNEFDYKEKIEKILKFIERGETYQVNFTFKTKFDFEGDILSFYQALKLEQKVPYSALIHDGRIQILCLSPELFFKRVGNDFQVKPMKGTSNRGLSILDDNALLNIFKNDPKIIAENSMIVDLLRNDIGKISEIGSVQLHKLMEVEEYETLFQMTSTIKSTLRNNVSYFDIFKAIFPCGSVTGVPKYRTMQIIQDLESSPREIYTGAIGFISKSEAIFNIPIRTIEIKNNQGTLGIGSGIVWDSIPKIEYMECILKQKFLQNTIPFQIMESMLYKNKTFTLLNFHLNRLRKSAQFFGFPFNENELLNSLNLLKEDLINKKTNSRLKIKVLLSKLGEVTLEYSNILKQPKKVGVIQIHKIKINSKNIFQHHKTTNRKIYEDGYKMAIENNLTDYIYLNEKNEVVEASIYNIFIKLNGLYFTPSISSGCLRGVMREYLIQKVKLKEKTLTIQELKNANAIYICNSIRGIMRVHLK